MSCFCVFFFFFFFFHLKFLLLFYLLAMSCKILSFRIRRIKSCINNTTYIMNLLCCLFHFNRMKLYLGPISHHLLLTSIYWYWLALAISELILKRFSNTHFKNIFLWHGNIRFICCYMFSRFHFQLTVPRVWTAVSMLLNVFHNWYN